MSNPSAKMGLRRKPYVFTEQGVAMLSSVLRSPQAVQVNIEIMRAFVKRNRSFCGVTSTYPHYEYNSPHHLAGEY